MSISFDYIDLVLFFSFKKFVLCYIFESFFFTVSFIEFFPRETIILLILNHFYLSPGRIYQETNIRFPQLIAFLWQLETSGFLSASTQFIPNVSFTPDLKDTYLSTVSFQFLAVPHFFLCMCYLSRIFLVVISSCLWVIIIIYVF